MVDDNGVAGIKEIFGQFDDTRIGGKDRGCRAGTKIDAIVITFQLSVKDPFIAKGAGHVAGHGQLKVAFPQPINTAIGIDDTVDLVTS
jgi:hypothetical protein